MLRRGEETRPYTYLSTTSESSAGARVSSTASQNPYASGYVAPSRQSSGGVGARATQPLAQLRAGRLSRLPSETYAPSPSRKRPESVQRRFPNNLRSNDQDPSQPLRYHPIYHTSSKRADSRARDITEVSTNDHVPTTDIEFPSDAAPTSEVTGSLSGTNRRLYTASPVSSNKPVQHQQHQLQQNCTHQDSLEKMQTLLSDSLGALVKAIEHLNERIGVVQQLVVDEHRQLNEKLDTLQSAVKTLTARDRPDVEGISSKVSSKLVPHFESVAEKIIKAMPPVRAPPGRYNSGPLGNSPVNRAGNLQRHARPGALNASLGDSLAYSENGTEWGGNGSLLPFNTPGGRDFGASMLERVTEERKNSPPDDSPFTLDVSLLDNSRSLDLSRTELDVKALLANCKGQPPPGPKK